MHPIALLLLMSTTLTTNTPARVSLPPVAEVQQQALNCARLRLDDSQDWRRRARRAAFVPRVQFDVGQHLRSNMDVNVNENVYVGASGVVTGPDDGGQSQSRTSDLTVGMRAVWELGEAVFSRYEIAASAEARSLLKQRNDLLEQVSRRYLAIQRMPEEVALLSRLIEINPRPDKAQHEIFLKVLLCEESAAVLDGMTNGWFFKAVGSAPVCEVPKHARKGNER